MSSTDRSTTDRDYSGVATAELAAVYEKYNDCDIVTFAARVGIDERDLKGYVITPKYPFTGLSIADRIVEGLGQTLNTLVEHGELHIIPAARGKDRGRVSARLMVEDEYWVRDLDPPSQEVIDARINELLELRRTLCVPSQAQAERRRRDIERAMARQTRLREERQDAA